MDLPKGLGKITFGIILVLVGGFFLRYQKTTSVPAKPHITQTIVSTTIENSEVHSPDGSMKLTMRTEGKDGQKTYSFFVAKISGENEKLLFTKTLTSKGKMMLPQNSWSPDNKHLFLQEEEGSFIKTFVFKASGEAFSKGEQYLDIGSLFKERNTKYTLKDVTGWDDPQLLHITTMQDVATKGPSYWFEIPSRAFLQLASR